MIKDITLGQYFPGESPLHKIDARIKILMSFIAIACTFASGNFLSLLFVLLCLIALILMSGISPLTILKGIKPVMFILLFTTVFQIFFTRTGKILFEWQFIRIYSDGIIYSIKMFLRIVMLISSASVLLTYTTSPIVLTDGIEGLLSPLKKLKVPVHDFALMMSIALRFIPTLTEETDKIMSAQRARGASFSDGSLMKRARALVSVFVPLLVSAIRRADELSTAMICRGYTGGEGRTRLRVMKIRPADIVWLIVSCLSLLSVIALNTFRLPLPEVFYL